MAHHRGCIRRCIGRIDELCIFVCAVRRDARQSGRRQLPHARGVCADGPHARRTGQSGGIVLGIEWIDFRLIGRQCADRWQRHHHADEARRLFAREGRCDRSGLIEQRPDHAAGDGRSRVFDGGVRQYSVQRNCQARVLAGDPRLLVALLHRAFGGAQGRHDRIAAPHIAVEGAFARLVRRDRRHIDSGAGFAAAHRVDSKGVWRTIQPHRWRRGGHHLRSTGLVFGALARYRD